jgi:hypothetical protein
METVSITMNKCVLVSQEMSTISVCFYSKSSLESFLITLNTGAL